MPHTYFTALVKYTSSIFLQLNNSGQYLVLCVHCPDKCHPELDHHLVFFIPPYENGRFYFIKYIWGILYQFMYFKHNLLAQFREVLVWSANSHHLRKEEWNSPNWSIIVYKDMLLPVHCYQWKKKTLYCMCKNTCVLVVSHVAFD